MSLIRNYSEKMEAGVDEAGRGCIAGPVVSAAVILPPDIDPALIRDSKKLSHAQRFLMRDYILEQAIALGVGMVSAPRIDEINILQATFEAMHQAIDILSPRPEMLLIDGNRFRPYPEIDHACIIKGDAKFLSIAAASILAKTYRDEVMAMLHEAYPMYNWLQNKGYPTADHRRLLLEHGPSPYHRLSFGGDKN